MSVTKQRVKEIFSETYFETIQGFRPGDKLLLILPVNGQTILTFKVSDEELAAVSWHEYWGKDREKSPNFLAGSAGSKFDQDFKMERCFCQAPESIWPEDGDWFEYVTLATADDDTVANFFSYWGCRLT